MMDNYGTHRHPKVQAWLQHRPRFIPHSVATGSSWLNLVERWFGPLTSKRVRQGSFFSAEDLQKAIMEFLETRNDDPKPFVWTATAESIVQELEGRQAESGADSTRLRSASCVRKRPWSVRSAEGLVASSHSRMLLSGEPSSHLKCYPRLHALAVVIFVHGRTAIKEQFP